MHALKRMQEVWPKGIPTQDYAAAMVMVIATVGGRAPEKKKPSRISAERLSVVRNYLSRRRATVDDIVRDLRIGYPSARVALAEIGRSVGTMPAPSGKGWLKVWTLKEEA